MNEIIETENVVLPEETNTEDEVKTEGITQNDLMSKIEEAMPPIGTMKLMDKPKEQIVKKKTLKELLPPIGTKFMVDGVEYEVCYVNIGKGRFSATPERSQY